MEDLSPDEWREIMEDHPAANNHGRRRTGAGNWTSLEYKEQSAWADDLDVEVDAVLHAKPRSKKPFDTIRHGTASAYTNDKCRCMECQAGWAVYKRERRRLNG